MGHESLCFFCCLVLLLVCFLCGSKTQNEEEGRDQAGVTSNSISSIWLLLCPLASRSLKTSVDSWLQSMDYLDLIGTSRDGLGHPEEIQGNDGSGEEWNSCVLLFSSDLGRKKTCGCLFFGLLCVVVAGMEE
ncbi:uncharacterized protein LOC103962020 isoform X2 [Pyrus x bretschneideri]|uniref:uncharacterized protein LOC103962020 isoform X2 n=1 Tax=Pyrus x bretschneideri TaxID=225117 RepID=UPI002030D220|nr:uncharacterized protein LOC103962020 isoform X2 [Pyrus x bretschneideri]